jgi:hypothetical protein
MNKLVLYRKVQASKHNLAIFSDIDSDHFEEMKFITEVDPIEITEEEMVKILRGIRIGGDLMLFNYEAEYLAKKILSKLTGDGDRT